jgi:hypothetical protein
MNGLHYALQEQKLLQVMHANAAKIATKQAVLCRQHAWVNKRHACQATASCIHVVYMYSITHGCAPSASALAVAAGCCSALLVIACSCWPAGSAGIDHCTFLCCCSDGCCCFLTEPPEGCAAAWDLEAALVPGVVLACLLPADWLSAGSTGACLPHKLPILPFQFLLSVLSPDAAATR